MTVLLFTPLIVPAVAALIGTALSALGAFGTSALNRRNQRKVNEHLTGKEQEQNAFNAEQAQINRDYQTEMSNTSYQRAVTDMQAAGVNPALSMSNGGASTPTGSNAQGSASLINATPIDFQSIIELMKAPAEIANIKADTELKGKEAEAKDTEIENLRVQIEGSKLDNEQKEIVLKYIEEQEQLRNRNLKLDAEQKEIEQKRLNSEIDKMDYEKMKIFSDYLKNLEEVEVLKSQKALNEAQLEQVAAMVKNLNAQSAMLGVEMANYDLTNGVTVKLDIGFGPFRAGSTQYLTLSQLREYMKAKESAARQREEDKKAIANGERPKENNAGLDYRDYRID